MPGNSAPKRTKEMKELDRVFIEHHHIRGKSTRQIAILLAQERPYTLSHQQIGYDLKVLVQRWREQSMQDITEAKSKELKGLDHQEAEAWDAYERSKQSLERTTVKKSEGGAQGAGARGEASKTTEQQVGDPAWMRVILEIRDRRANLLGLDAPAKQEFSGPGGAAMKVEGGGMIVTPEALVKFAADIKQYEQPATG